MTAQAPPATIDRPADAGASRLHLSDTAPDVETLREAVLKTARAPEMFRIVLPDAEVAEAVLEVRPIMPSVLAESDDAKATVTGSIDGGPFEVSVPAAALAMWVERTLPLAAWGELDPIARADVLDYLFADFIDLLENRAARPIRLDRIRPARADAPEPDFAFMLRLDGMTIHAAGHFEPDIVQGLTHWASGLPRRVVNDLAVPVSIRRGFCALTLEELQGLSVGDGLLFENLEASAGYVVAGETLGAPCRLEADRAVLLSPLHQPTVGFGRSWMSPPRGAVDFAPSPTEGPTGSIPVAVVFDVGRLDMTIDEINGLGEGHVFALDRLPRNLVEIVVHGKIIGRGEIIEHHALLAVRVTSLVA